MHTQNKTTVKRGDFGMNQNTLILDHQIPLSMSFSKELVGNMHHGVRGGTERLMNNVSGLKYNLKHSNFEEFQLPDPTGMQKRIKRTQNHTLHDSSRNEGYTHGIQRLGPLAELLPVDVLNSEAKRHSKY
jgi:hypothetical protein